MDARANKYLKGKGGSASSARSVGSSSFAKPDANDASKMEDVSKTEPTDAAVPQVVEPPKETQQQLFNQLLQPDVKLPPDDPPDQPSSPGHEPP